MGVGGTVAPHPYSQPHSAWGQFSLGQAREKGWCPQDLVQTQAYPGVAFRFSIPGGQTPLRLFRLGPKVHLGLSLTLFSLSLCS